MTTPEGRQVKGVSVFALRRLVRRAPEEVQGRVADALSGDDARVFERALATSWLPEDQVARIDSAVIPLLYADHPKPFERFGEEQAREDLGGVYSFLVRLTTVSFLIQQTAKVWKAYHTNGTCQAVQTGPGAGFVLLTDYPEYPFPFRHELTGYIRRMTRMTGAEDVVVRHVESDPARWMWEVRWRT